MLTLLVGLAIVVFAWLLRHLAPALSAIGLVASFYGMLFFNGTLLDHCGLAEPLAEWNKQLGVLMRLIRKYDLQEHFLRDLIATRRVAV